jgi:hypothetical protein
MMARTGFKLKFAAQIQYGISKTSHPIAAEKTHRNKRL